MRLSSRSASTRGCVAQGLTRAASSGRQLLEQASLSTGCGAGPAGAAAVARGRRLAFAQQGVEFAGHQLAHLAQAVEQLAGIAAVSRGRPGPCWRDPGQVAVAGGQQVRLLVVEVLDAVLDPAQEVVARGQCWAVSGFISPRSARRCSARQRRARADLGELPAAHHQHQLHDEFDLADAAARLSLTSLARSGRPAARRCASSRILRCSWRRPSKTP
jgi:hypothetical protein